MAQGPALEPGLHCLRGRQDRSGGAIRARREASARRLPDPRARDQRLPAGVSRLGLEHPEAPCGDRQPRRHVLVELRQRAPRRLHAGRGDDRALRGCEGEGPRLPRGREHARGDLRPRHDRGPQPRRLRMGTQAPARRRRDRRDRDGAPLQPRAVAVPGASDRAPSCATCRSTTTVRSTSPASSAPRPRGPCGSSRPCTSRTRSARSTRSRSSGRGVARTTRCSSWTAPRARRIDRSTCSALGCDFFAFSGPQARRARAPARCTAARSVSGRWTRS